jgi:hypothetical protein
MTTMAPEDHHKIRDLQANVKRALERWDTSDEKAQEFARLVPVVNELVDAQQEPDENHAAAAQHP